MADLAAKRDVVTPSDDKGQGAVARLQPPGEQAKAAPPDAPAPDRITELDGARSGRRRGLGKRLLRFFAMVVLPLVVLAYGAVLWGQSMRYISTENAYVKANLITISPDITGRVIAVHVAENQAVAKGQPLFTIDPRPFEIDLEAARAQVATVRQEIESLRSEYLTGLGELREAQEQANFLQGEYARQQQLAARGVVTQTKLDEARHELDLARQQVRTAAQRNRTTLAQLGGDPEIEPERHPRFLRALAEIERRQLDLNHTRITAPAAGIVSNITLQPGEYVESGDPIFTLIETESPWIEANLKETQLTHVEIGQSATVVADAYPDVVFDAAVTSISPATGAEFALLPPQNASGNWVKVVQRVPLRLSIEPRADLPPLRAGMTVTVSIDSERDRSIGTLVHEAMAWVGLDGLLPPTAQAAHQKNQ